MENRVEKAVINHRSGYNCSQAVACAFCDKVGVSEEMMYQMMEGYGFGMGCMEGVCGALSGAIAVASLKTSQSVGSSGNRRRECYRISKQIIKGFQEKNKSIICRELKGVDSGNVLRDCPGCVADAAALLQAIVFDKFDIQTD